MMPFIYYQFKVAICLALLTGLYYLLFRKDTFHGFNRIYLVSSIPVSLIIPLIHIAPFKNGDGFLPLVINAVTIVAGRVSITEIKSNQSLNCISWTYFAIAAIFSVYLVMQLGSMVVLILRSKIRIKEGYKIVVMPNHSSQSFSFFNLIFLPGYPDEQYRQVILHELAHARQFHSMDILLVQLTKIVQWFNPFLYFLEKAVKETHEYLADKTVLEQDSQSGGYRQILLAQALGIQPGIFSFFNQSNLINRLTMMTKQNSPSCNRLKYLAALPLIFILGLMMCCEHFKTNQASKAEKEQPYIMVDEQATFQGGGTDAFIQWVQANLVYPPEAKQYGISGRVVLQFTVNSLGAVDEVKVLRSASPSLEKESIRVLSSSPKWKPAKVSGKPVKQVLVMPINFALP